MPSKADRDPANLNASPIGVFDSGVGGLTVLRALLERLPGEDFVYLGDTARLPYGTKSPGSIRQYSLQAARLLHERGVKCLVVACNTATAVALDALTQEFAPVPVIGVIEPGAAAACRATHSGRIAVLATESTVRGGAYQAEIARRRPGAVVIARACPLFVALAEEGWTDGPIVEGVIHRYLDEVFAAGAANGAAGHPRPRLHPLPRACVRVAQGAWSRRRDRGLCGDDGVGAGGRAGAARFAAIRPRDGQGHVAGDGRPGALCACRCRFSRPATGTHGRRNRGPRQCAIAVRCLTVRPASARGLRPRPASTTRGSRQ